MGLLDHFSCEQSAPENGDRIEPSSDTMRELSKVSVVQKASSAYYGLVNRSKTAKFIAEKLATPQTAISSKILRSSSGKKVDSVLAQATKMAVEAKASDILSTFVSKAVARLIRNTVGAIRDFFVWTFHLFFRFFPITFAFRWLVDIALFFSEISLAFWYDYARWWENWQSLKIVNSAENPEAECERNGDLEEEEISDRVLRPSTSPILNMWSRFTRFIASILVGTIQAVYVLVNLVNLFVIIPWLNIQVLVLIKVSEFNHWLAGIEPESEEKTRHKTYITSHLLDYPAPPTKDISKRKYMQDSVLDYYFGVLVEIGFIASIMDRTGIRRPIHVIRNAHRFVKKLLLAWLERDLARYLQTDLSYDEAQDPDFIPGDSSDDSLEYADDLDNSSFQDAANEGEDKTGKEEKNGYDIDSKVI